MVRLSFPNVEELKRMHYEAVKSYVSETMHAKKRKGFYYKVIELAGFEAYERDYDEEGDTYDWLKHFLLADCETLVSWVEYHADKLKFDCISTGFPKVRLIMSIKRRHIMPILSLRK